MAYKVIIDPVASLDLTENIDWYNNTHPGLGLKFYKQIQAVLKTIQKNPHTFSIRYKTSHTATVKNFPFMVHYFIDDDNKNIVVTSVLHTSRNPKIWDERSEE